jgi:C4-dicarboxylate-specific signal transduction histidine kinase
VNALVADSVRLAYHGARGWDDAGEVRIDETYDPAVREATVDAAEIRRVLINIINNALYALHDKRRAAGVAYAPALAVQTQDRGDRVEITIRDNGTGIAGDVLPKIYNPFFTTKPAGQGAGLGLSISREIVVDGHHGDLRVETVPGELTAFHVILPKQSPAA